MYDFVSGGNLNDYMVEHNINSEEQFNFMLNIAKGMNFLHSKTIIHGDLRPQNILIKTGKKNQVVCALTDYGLYKIQGPFTTEIDTQDIASWYQAPEVTDGSEYSKEADVFSLGCIFHVLTDERKMKVNDSVYLVPVFKDERRQRKYRTVVDASKGGEVKTYLGPSFSNVKILGDVIIAMLDSDPHKRPKVSAAMVKVAEAKGAFFADREGRRQKRRDFIPGLEMLLSSSTSGFGSSSGLGSTRMLDSASSWSFEDDLDSDEILVSMHFSF